MAKPIIIVFARAPRLGLVKRRLAKDIGDVAALRFYRNQLARTLRRLNRLPVCEKILCHTPRNAFIPTPVGWRKISQGQGDLGSRMQQVIQAYPNRRVVLVGADIPALNANDVKSASRSLLHHDAVFGSARDGGFYLVGVSARHPTKLFANVRWSTRHALTDTLQNFIGFRVAFGRVLRDVDTAKDLRKL